MSHDTDKDLKENRKLLKDRAKKQVADRKKRKKIDTLQAECVELVKRQDELRNSIEIPMKQITEKLRTNTEKIKKLITEG